MTDETVRNIVAKTGRSPEEARAAIAAMSPQNRIFAPSEVTAAALWLCGPGSQGVTGAAIPIAGGEV
jgi:NAD(P)-dependent dehydrogenase (short-subunit alcohol dehydrogenase family)